MGAGYPTSAYCGVSLVFLWGIWCCLLAKMSRESDKTWQNLCSYNSWCTLLLANPPASQGTVLHQPVLHHATWPLLQHIQNPWSLNNVMGIPIKSSAFIGIEKTICALLPKLSSHTCLLVLLAFSPCHSGEGIIYMALSFVDRCPIPNFIIRDFYLTLLSMFTERLS